MTHEKPYLVYFSSSGDFRSHLLLCLSDVIATGSNVLKRLESFDDNSISDALPNKENMETDISQIHS